ncbi:MAG: AraC family transcriptional regulator [Victivallales bacterium]|nr:AraC family transcriptional regulator [Victivallales bacterium]
MIINPTFRYPTKPLMSTLVNVRSCGHYWIPTGPWHDGVQRKKFLQLFWGIRGTAVVGREEGETLLEPEKVCFYLPGDLHRISLKQPPLEYCFLTFDGDLVEELIRRFHITRETRHAGPCPMELFQSLILNLHDYSTRGEYLASADGYRILCLAFAGRKVENTLAERFKAEVSENLADPKLQPSKIAATLGIHPTTLTRNIHAVSGMTPKEYITALRLQRVLALIRTSPRSFKEIAQETGFDNANYLAKVFRRKFGCSPTEFRNGTELSQPMQRMSDSVPVPNRETIEAIEEGERIAHAPNVPGYRDMKSLRKALDS